MKQTILLLMATLGSLAELLHAKTITVDNRVGSVAMFSNLQSAINAAEPDDTILIAGSPTAYGNVTVTKKLHFVGPGYFLAENNIPGITKSPASVGIYFSHVKTETFFSTSSGSTVNGLWGAFQADGTIYVSGISFDRCAGQFKGYGSRFIINRCWDTGSQYMLNDRSGSIVRNSYLNGVSAGAGTTVENSVIFGGGGSNAESSISNCIFVTTGSGISASDFANSFKGSVTYCLAVGGLQIAGQPTFLKPGEGNLPTIAFVSDVFEQGQVADQIYRLKVGSPALGRGLNGVDLGMFGGTSPYIISGVPSRPRITHMVSPSSATSSSGLEFEVHAESF